MSRFYASIQGNRGEATRTGAQTSGITGHVRGWHIGGKVDCRVNDKDEDEVLIYLTAGSSSFKPRKLLGIFKEKDL